MTNKTAILVIGDAMIDRYISGSVHRISPEAPVPIVKVNQEYATLGGAANVAKNLAMLRCPCTLFAPIGNDSYGMQLQSLLLESNIHNNLVTCPTYTTISKTRVVSRGQQMMRIDREEAFNDHDFVISQLQHILKNNDFQWIIVSDYEKGLCSPKLMDCLAPYMDKVLVDPKGKNWLKYSNAYLVKPNLLELEEISLQNIENTDTDIAEFGKKIKDTYHFDNLVVTRSDQGMSWINKEGVEHFKTKKVDVYDVSGAGDTAIATIAFGLYQGNSLRQAINLANKASSFVVTKPQTYAISLEELERLI